MDFLKVGNGYVLNDENGTQVAEITYSPANDKFVIADHTLVAEHLEGQGIAGKLLDHLMMEMEKEGKKILPLCPYVVRKFEQQPDKYDHINYHKQK